MADTRFFDGDFDLAPVCADLVAFRATACKVA